MPVYCTHIYDVYYYYTRVRLFLPSSFGLFIVVARPPAAVFSAAYMRVRDDQRPRVVAARDDRCRRARRIPSARESGDPFFFFFFARCTVRGAGGRGRKPDRSAPEFLYCIPPSKLITFLFGVEIRCKSSKKKKTDD